MTKRSSKRKSGSTSRSWLGVLIALIVVASALFGWQWWTQRSGTPAVSAARIAEQHGRGPVTAKVTVVEYGDFDCPTCKAYFNTGILQRLLKAYPNQVRLVFRHLPIITPVSPKLAEASECAADQGAFWPFHDLLYEMSPTQPAQMPNLAQQLGLDVPAFTSCLDSDRYAGLVQAETQEGFQHGFHATPAFVVNGEPLVGPPSYNQLQQRIDTILQSSQ
jgi:protein-disulfide isomerase